MSEETREQPAADAAEDREAQYALEDALTDINHIRMSD